MNTYFYKALSIFARIITYTYLKRISIQEKRLKDIRDELNFQTIIYRENLLKARKWALIMENTDLNKKKNLSLK